MLNPAPKENTVEAYLKSRVEAMGGRCLKFVSPGTAGVPDRLILLPNGVVAFVEAKRLGESPRPLQAKFLRDVRRLGFFADSTDSHEEVDFLLATLDEVVRRG